MLSEADLIFYRRNGFLIVPSLFSQAELSGLDFEANSLIAKARSFPNDPDFLTGKFDSKTPHVPFRVEYVVDKLQSVQDLLGNPKLLAVIEQIQGSDFIPTWDSLVFRSPEAGLGINWHQDFGGYPSKRVDRNSAAIDVGIYLDDSTLEDCVWMLAGSHQWPQRRVRAEIRKRKGFPLRTQGATPLLVKRGDLVIHNIHTLHAADHSLGSARRVVYFDFRRSDVERRYGPHSETYLSLKKTLLRKCIEGRTNRSSVTPQALRVPHELHWSKEYRRINWWHSLRNQIKQWVW